MGLSLSGRTSAPAPDGPALGSTNASRRPPDTPYADSLSWGEDKNREKKDTFLLLLFTEPNSLVFKGLSLMEL